MEFDFLNQIITTSVGSLFKPITPKLQKREAVTLPETPTLQFTKNVKPQTSTSLNASIASTSDLGKKSRDNSMSGADLRSLMESSLNISREDQNSFKSPVQTLQKSVEIGRTPLITAENTRPLSRNSSTTKSIESLQLSVQSSTASLASVDTKLTPSLTESKDFKQQLKITQMEDLQTKQTKPLQQLSVEAWVAIEGPKKLEESLKRLKLDIVSISKINLEELSLEALQAQKRAVKNELKAYDSSFYAAFKKQPERREKEVMRPLYVYYKKLKQHMAKPKPKEVETKSPNMNPHFSTVRSTGQLSEGSLNRQHQQQLFSSLKNENLLGSNSHTLAHQNSKGPSKENVITSPIIFGSKQSGQSIGSTGTLNYKSNQVESSNSKLEELKAERNRLREKLHKYQAEFTKNHNRKIRYHKDIEPIEEEYKRYKNIKSEIARLEGAVQNQFK